MLPIVCHSFCVQCTVVSAFAYHCSSVVPTQCDGNKIRFFVIEIISTEIVLITDYAHAKEGTTARKVVCRAC